MPGEFDMDAAVNEVGVGLGFDDSGADAGADNDPGANIEVGEGDLGEATVAAGVKEAAAAAVAGAPPVDPSKKEAAPTDPAADPSATPPNSWRPEAKEAWATIPPAARAEILKREQDIHKGLEGYRVDAEMGRSVKSVLEPYMATLQQHNIDPAAQIAGLMKAHHTLALGSPQEKSALFQQLAKDYGIALPGAGDGDEPPYVDPAVADLRKEVQALRSNLSARERQETSAKQADLVTKVEAFAADPANIHFEEVANDMATLVQSGVAKTLEEAYDKAVWANPAVRAKEQARQAAAAEATRRQQDSEKAVKARAATGANVTTSARRSGATTTTGSMDDTLAETLASIKARG